TADSLFGVAAAGSLSAAAVAVADSELTCFAGSLSAVAAAAGSLSAVAVADSPLAAVADSLPAGVAVLNTAIFVDVDPGLITRICFSINCGFKWANLQSYQFSFVVTVLLWC
ncbi:MAG: hypothetical protein GX877_05065, partial [Bacteroidales bacterium]|nr:hypothetical protein [Bacteroidales bacterium]